jgi:protein phosphatase
MSTLRIPELALVALVGSSGSGKSTFGRKHFLPTEVLSSDFFRGLVSDNEVEQSATRDAFDALHFIAAKRLRNGRLTVIDATNVQPEARKPIVELAREFDVLPVAIVLDLPERVCHERNRERPDRQFGPHVVRRQRDDLRRSLRGLEREGFRHVFVLSSLEEVEAVTIERQPLWTNRRQEHGPFDLIGDVHGCCDELEALLGKLGYTPDSEAVWRHPAGRKVVFLGDLVDRGPRVLDTLNLARRMVAAETALCVPGNHDVKLHRWLRGKKVQVTHGLEQSIREIEALPEAEAPAYRKELEQFLDSLVSHYVLDDGKLVVAHAGLKAEYQGRASRRVREFALYGETTGETDEFGLPVRYPWAQEYRGSALVVYGHTPVPEPEWLNRTLNLDTGCVFGGRLTALRYPELELVTVPAAREYAVPIRPLRPEPARSAQQEHDDLLELEDVSGKRIVNTRLRPNITIREENTIAALEVMSRFAANPKWLIYLPPTMSPSETSREPGLLEHPAEALAYFQSEGVERVVCEEKHMGSRAVVIVCRDEEAARRRFGIDEAESGIVYTRTGRRFFEDLSLEAELLNRVRVAFDTAGLWDELETDWICLDCELMPWSAKAQALLIQQYAPVGAAATAALDATLQALEQAKVRGGDVDALLARHTGRREMAERYVAAYRRYCWDVHSLADLRLAPFHILATEGKVPVDRDHVWHMETLRRACAADPDLLLATPYRVIDLTDEASRAGAVEWWTELTARGGEGMVVKPFDFVTEGRRGLVQPALKCRGAEYLRIIYGPEYTQPENLERLRQRGLGAKRSLAHREFALGIEGLERFVQREPLRRVHECVFSVLALESEPVDPRL